MASLANTMFASASRAIETSKPDLAGSFAQGAQIAQKHQQMEIAQQQLVANQAKVKQKGAENIFKLMATADKFQDKTAGNKFRAAALGPAIQANGVEDLFPPHIQEAMQGSEEVRLGMAILQDKVRKGEMGFEDAAKQAQDIDGLVTMSNLSKASQGFVESGEKQQRADTVAAGQNQRNENTIRGRKEAAKVAFAQIGPKQVATKVAQDFVEYNTKGKRVALVNNLDALEKAVAKLNSGDVSTGSLSTKIPGISSDAVQSIVNQEMLNVQNDARAAIMPLLRATLGSQFTEKEGERIFGTVFDPKAPAEENARRMTRKIGELRETIRDKETSFIDQGLMKPADRTPIRQTEAAAAAAAPAPEVIAQVKQIMLSDPSLQGLNGDQLLGWLQNNVPGLPDATYQAIIKNVQITQKPGAK